MAERLLIAARGKVPHHGPVTQECPVECLLTVLSLNSFNPLTRAYDAPFDEPRTVADVMDLCARRELRKIRGVGPRRGSEIEAALVLAGLNLAGHQERPRAGRTAARPGAPLGHAPGARARNDRSRDSCAAISPGAARPGFGPAAPRVPRPGRDPDSAALRPCLDPRDPVGVGHGRIGRRRRARRQLVTNSVNACAGLDQAAVRLVLTFDRDELAILVRDDHPDVPMAAQPGADDESGRGLLIVEHLSDRCGWYPLEDAKPAKVTCAVISGAGQAAGDLSAEPHPGAGRAAAARAVPVLPARHRRPPLVPAGMKGPRTVDPDILARVKVALERL